MGSGAFNITRLIAELGLKNVSELDVIERIQPVLPIGNLSDLTPPHVAPSALFGNFLPAVVALFGVFEIQCLAPGGAFVDWFSYIGSGDIGVRILVTPQIPAAPIIAPAGQASRDPVVSVARSDNVVFGGGFEIPTFRQNQNFFTFSARGMFIPRGSFVNFQSQSSNNETSFGIGWREVPATEHVPS